MIIAMGILLVVALQSFGGFRGAIAGNILPEVARLRFEHDRMT